MNAELLEELVQAAMSEAYPEGDDGNPDEDFVSCNESSFRKAFKKVLDRKSKIKEEKHG